MRLPSPYRDERSVVTDRLIQLGNRLDWGQATRPARGWVEAVRSHPPHFWAMERLLHEYPISSAEGLALMRLAEALSRIPDLETAIALTADQLGRANFGDGHDSLLGQVSGMAMKLSRQLLPEEGEHQGLWQRLGARTVVAAGLRAVQLLGAQFVMGETIEDAQRVAQTQRRTQPALRFSYDMLGEAARTANDAERYFASYREAIRRLAAERDPAKDCREQDGISIKLSALHPRYEWAQQDRVMSELVPRVWSLCDQAAAANMNLTIDAEEVDRLEISLDVFEALLELVARHARQWQGFGLAMQAYQTRALDLVDHVIGLAQRHDLQLMCRLVKGAYWDSEIKRAQELGLPHYPVFTHKQHTDISYLACAARLLEAPDRVFPQFATHNAGSIAALVQLARDAEAPFELQRLHGMGEGIYREVLQALPVSCRVYAPVGAHRDLLAYLVRRLLENGANASFVHQLADDHVSTDELLESPLALQSGHPIMLPDHLFGMQRLNSSGLDLAEAEQREALGDALATLPLVALQTDDTASVDAAMRRARAAFPLWSQQPVETRAGLLQLAAERLELAMPRFAAMLVQEARKCWPDAIAEVREAIDFLRYYADEALRLQQAQTLPGPTGEQNTLQLRARGVWIAISPWNFPLAIFTGQIAAALVTGNCVIAKPAEQTPRIATEMLSLLHAAGVPTGALQMLHGTGEIIGASLVAHPQVNGVVFTGSTAVAKIIQRALAAKDGPIVPLIAETGGINAMLVDASALPEQVADAVLQSAFRSAGQRCSALRLLCLHDGIVKRVLDLVAGAASELRVGDPADFATDVGPLIDAEAFATVKRHIGRLRETARIRLAPTAPAQPHHLVAPHIFEVASVADVSQEIFGPVLQVVRWSGDPAAVVDAINALGYGLTLGIHTRIDRRAAALAARARAGNVYVNRNMIGAVVGVQPFGGEGLSGTGPKAGGPHYLLRFCSEQVVTINTAAAGGNARLLGKP
ncbi:MAG: L-glutamate gamma-semialdehyde dehydrogenase [Rhodocyclaceae bacterium]